MKSCCLLFLVCSVFFVELKSQSVRTLRVRAGDDIAQAYSPTGFYRFRQFGKATLYFTSGKRNGTDQFNYNILSGNLQFISPAGDTLDLAGQESIDSVEFANTVFLNRDGLMEAIASADSVRLLKKITIKTQFENIGAYGLSNTTGSIDNLKTFYAANGVYNLVLAQDIVVVETTAWFWMKGNSQPVKASKNNLLGMLSPAAKPKAEAWLKKNKINFDKKADLLKLIDAIAG